MRILLDTSYLFDLVDRPGTLPDQEHRILAARGTEFHVSAVSIWEVRLRHGSRHPPGERKSRLCPDDVLAVLQDQDVTYLPMTVRHAHFPFQGRKGSMNVALFDKVA